MLKLNTPTCQLTRDDRFFTTRRFSVRMGGGFRLGGGTREDRYLRTAASIRATSPAAVLRASAVTVIETPATAAAATTTAPAARSQAHAGVLDGHPDVTAQSQETLEARTPSPRGRRAHLSLQSSLPSSSYTASSASLGSSNS